MSSRHCKTTFDHFSLLLWYQVTSLVRISLPNLSDRKALGGGTPLHYNPSNLGFEREQGRGVNARCDVITHISSPPHLSETFSNLNPGVGFTSLTRKEQAVNVLGDHRVRQEGNKNAFLQTVLSKKPLATPPQTPAIPAHCHHWPSQFKISFKIIFTQVFICSLVKFIL